MAAILRARDAGRHVRRAQSRATACDARTSGDASLGPMPCSGGEEIRAAAEGEAVVGEAQAAIEGAVQEECERVLALLEAHSEEVSAAMVDGIVTQVPLYRQLSDELRLAHVRLQCSRQIQVFLARARTGAEFAGADMDAVRATTAQRVNELVPVESLLHATRAAHRVCREWLLERVEDGPVGSAAALRLSDLMIEQADTISTVIAAEYARCEGRRVAYEDRLRGELLERLLSGGAPLDDEAAGVMLAAGLREGPYAAVVMAARPLNGAVEADPQERASLLLRALSRAGIPAFGADRDGETVVVAALRAGGAGRALAVAGEVCAAMGPTHGIDARAGISRAHATLGEVPLAYSEAARALRHAATGGAASLDDVGLLDYLVAEADPLAARLVPGAVRELLVDDGRRGGELARTVLAFADADLNAARAAAALFVHVNTVHYRLRRIAEITGLDARRFQDLVQLVLAVRLVR
jgi:hypothetical protein